MAVPPRWKTVEALFVALLLCWWDLEYERHLPEPEAEKQRQKNSLFGDKCE